MRSTTFNNPSFHYFTWGWGPMSNIGPFNRSSRYLFNGLSSAAFKI
ncbi:hypothetical protein VCHA54P501_230046 [Vibrio chagasii]|nr:hypothetical protein VCHA54P501_230046 [Vibrio chagasii]